MPPGEVLDAPPLPSPRPSFSTPPPLLPLPPLPSPALGQREHPETGLETCRSEGALGRFNLRLFLFSPSSNIFLPSHHFLEASPLPPYLLYPSLTFVEWILSARHQACRTPSESLEGTPTCKPALDQQTSTSVGQVLETEQGHCRKVV